MDIDLTNLRVTDQGGVSRAAADLNGAELYFESPDWRLTPSAEAFASVLLPVAAVTGSRLVVDTPLDPLWLRNAARILRIWQDWWSTEPELGRVLVAEVSSSTSVRAGGVGLCFSLGVDSFFSLLRSGRSPDVLVAVEGFDVPLGDADRMMPIDRGVRDVAAAGEAQAVVMRTNIRDHPHYPTHEWERTHGGALAVLGHLNVDHVGELLISSTKPTYVPDPWGSHWETDPLWSSSRLAVTHVGGDYRRNEKVARLVDEPLVQQHLRVCWENRTASGNCGECEKCVRTMILINAFGSLDDFPTFALEGSLRERVDALPGARPFQFGFYNEVLSQLESLDRADEDLIRSLRRLLARSDTNV